MKLFQRASKLDVNSKQPGTTSNYQLFINKWVSWCHKQQTHLHDCHSYFLVDSLVHLYEQKLAHSTINSDKAVLSGYHNLVNNMTIDQQTKVCISIHLRC